MTSLPMIIGAVRGLVSDGKKVATIIESYRPDIVGLSVSKEGLEAMGKMDHTSNKPTNVEEKIYIRGLSTFGKVIKPPPCFSEALKQANSLKIQVKPLDMDDEHFTAAFCKYVNTLDMIKQGRRGKAFSKYVFRAKTPNEFVIEWDRLVNRLEGYKALESAREKWLAKGIYKLSENYSRPLIIIEFERLGGVQRYLKAMGMDFQVIH
ncbi:MAG: hypothetical protein Q7J68_03105 [Thermoplasmata archaeon]|nr:hypothetical protein [Thermoplasmata archaeon]